MIKLLLLLFLFSISSNVFADEFEEFEKMAERKSIICWTDTIDKQKIFSTDGENLYYGHNHRKVTKVISERDRKMGSFSNEVTKKPDELKFIVKSFGCINYPTPSDASPCVTREKSDRNLTYTETVFIDFENVNMIFKEIREEDGSIDTQITQYTCELVERENW